jgi:hypothetical protein
VRRTDHLSTKIITPPATAMASAAGCSVLTSGTSNRSGPQLVGVELVKSVWVVK